MHISAILNQETMLSSGALKSMQTERLPGYGKIVVEDYGIGEGDLLLICNAYGINSATIDAALTAKERGAMVIGVSSHSHAENCPLNHPARHPSKKNLHDIVDCSVDCKVRLGDATIELPGFEQKIGALSTYANAYVMNSIVVEAINMLVNEGINPPVWRSGNCPGGDEWNNQFIERFREQYAVCNELTERRRICHLYYFAVVKLLLQQESLMGRCLQKTELFVKCLWEERCLVRQNR